MTIKKLLVEDSTNAVATSPNTTRRSILGATGFALAGGLSLPSVSLAQAKYPNKPIKIVIPWPPGQATDLVGRALAQGLTQVLGQSVVPDNKAGAGGLIGTDYVAKAAPDGYTLLAGSSGPISISPLLQQVPYDPVNDLTPIGMCGLSGYILVTEPNFPASTAGEFIKLLKANPDKYSFSSSGTGATAHLVAEAFNAAVGIKAIHVPYKGSSPALTDVMAGRVSYCLETAAATMPFIRNGRLKALGVSLEKGTATAPGIPPLATVANIPGFNLGAWIGLVAPGKLPPELVEILSKAVRQVMQDPNTVEVFSRISVDIDFRSQAETIKYLASTRTQFSEVIKKNNIKI
jgi:tripartite-type tricarboxylate transporter receptor subunit TctC